MHVHVGLKHTYVHNVHAHIKNINMVRDVCMYVCVCMHTHTQYKYIINAVIHACMQLSLKCFNSFSFLCSCIDLLSKSRCALLDKGLHLSTGYACGTSPIYINMAFR